ncbi:MAG TPA: DUF1214 domain-containing protein [Xanthobacteraceae bacterium]|nr:DUF1214 domain-containing protein [Xanthobacteraceae bacterium]
MNRIALASFAFILAAGAQAQPARLSDKDIVDAYQYMLGRWLVLRQETLDLKEGLKWNEVKHREPGGVAWANPNLDVAYSEAWIAIDEASCALVDLPEIKGRYYTVQVLNGWGEVTANINERNFPRHPSGTFALCLKGAKVALPAGTQRIDLPNKKSRILMRVELGADPAAAAALQKKITMKPTGSPKVEPTAATFDFPNNKFPGVEAFDKTEQILTSEPDINKGMAPLQRKVRAVAKAASDPKERVRIDEVIQKQAIPGFHAELANLGRKVNGWMHPRVVGNYGSDYLMRSLVNFAGIWANNAKEAVYFVGKDFDGSQTYIQTYPKSALPGSKVRYFWSVIVVDNDEFRVVPNPLNRFLLNKQSALQYNADGSLTLAFAPKQPDGVPQANWLPTPEGKKYDMTYRFYGPASDVVSGKYYPPALTVKR